MITHKRFLVVWIALLTLLVSVASQQSLVDAAKPPPKEWLTSGNAGSTPLTDFLGTTDSQDLVFKTNGNEAIRIDINGHVGIGTSTPGQLLSLRSGRSKVGVLTIADDVNSTLQLRRARAGTLAVINDDVLGVVNGRGLAGTEYERAAAIQFSVDGTPGLADMPGRIEFRTTPDGSNLLVERMRIDNAGNVGIHTTSPQSALQVSGYTQIDLTSGAPPSGDCNAESEAGRMKFDSTADLLYICSGLSGWVAK